MREYKFITRYHKGTAEEVNAYLDQKLEDKSFSWYFSRKYADFASLFLYIIYSNMGSRNAEGLYGYYGRPLAIMVRFPGEFFEITPPPMVELNQLFLILASAVILFLSVWI